MRENHDLMKEFRFIAKQHTHEQGEISVFQHYHQFNKHRSNYVQTIKTNLKTISNSHNASSFLLLGEYLSYLIAFESDFAEIFEDERKIYVAQAL